MAKLNFAQRFRTDTTFRAAVEDIHLEAVLESTGINPEDLNEAWEAGVRPLTLSVFRSIGQPKSVDEQAKPVAERRTRRKTSESSD